MKLFSKLSAIVLTAALCVSGLGFTSCSNDDFSTEQYTGGIRLNVFGPSPVARGGELRFLGSGMDQITSVEIPGCGTITDFTMVTPNELRIIVPQTAQPGKVVLNYAKGTITTLTPLSFTEPISLDAFSPARIKPGQELTITGEYLNLIGEVIFADNVVVAADDFSSQSRDKIVVKVPAEAQSGKIIISDANPDIPNWIYSEEVLDVVLPAPATVQDLTDAKPGDVITVQGSDLDLVVALLLVAEGHDDMIIDYTYSDGVITFVLPEDTFDGAICAVPASGVKVAVANIGMVVPSELMATPAEGLRADDTLTITGINIDQVVSVSFPNVAEAVEPATISGTQLTVLFPAMAQSGDVVLNLRSGKTASVAVATAKPEVTGFDPEQASAAGAFAMVGHNLDLVVKVDFQGGVSVDVETPGASDRLDLVCPATAATGALTLHMANGETVTTPSLTVNAPACAYITGVVTEKLLGGELMEVTIENADKLTEVQVNGQTVQYVLNGSRLYILLPQLAGEGSEIKLISSNGEIAYTYDVIPATHVENVIWSGAFECSGWNGNMDLAYGAYDWNQIPVGAIVNFYLTSTVPDGEWWCISLRHGDSWGGLAGVPGQYDMPESPLQVEWTQEIIDDLNANMGLVITGTGFILTKIVAEWEIDVEKAIWEGPLEITWSDGGRVMIPAASLTKPGKVMRFYFAQKDQVWAQAQINDGWWTGLVFPEVGSNTLVPTDVFGWDFSDNRTFDVTLTEEVVNQIQDHQGDCEGQSNIGIIIQGSDIIFKKVTLLP